MDSSNGLYNKIVKEINGAGVNVDDKKSRCISFDDTRYRVKEDFEKYHSILYIVLKPTKVDLFTHDLFNHDLNANRLTPGRSGDNLDILTETYLRVYGVMSEEHMIMMSNIGRDSAGYEFGNKNDRKKKTLVRICFGYEEVNGLPAELTKKEAK